MIIKTAEDFKLWMDNLVVINADIQGIDAKDLDVRVYTDSTIHSAIEVLSMVLGNTWMVERSMTIVQIQIEAMAIRIRHEQKFASGEGVNVNVLIQDTKTLSHLSSEMRRI